MENHWDISSVLKEQIRHLPPDLKRRVWEALDEISKNPESGKMLEDELAGLRSFRIGKYRLIYKVEADRLVLEAVGSRRDIYERIIIEIARQKIRERSAQYKVAKKIKKKKAPKNI